MTPYSGSTGGGGIATSLNLLDTTDIALGGSGGAMNNATKKTADNFAYINNIFQGFEFVVVKSTTGSPVSITGANIKRNLVQLQIGAAVYGVFNLPAASTCRVGDRTVIGRRQTGYNNPVSLVCNGSDAFIDIHGTVIGNTIYLHGNDHVELYFSEAGYWRILNTNSNMFNVGDQMFGYYQKPGTLIRQGQLVNRADYPRLWALCNAQFAPISDSSWTGSASNRGYFSTGDGSTTFRIADDRGVFERALPLGDTLRDPDRSVSATPGNYEADQLVSHKHEYDVPDNSFSPHTFGNTGLFAGFLTLPWKDTSNTGGTETRPKNVGKIPLIVY